MRVSEAMTRDVRIANPTDTIRQAAQATRHYAKRQLTWFRKEQGARFVWPPGKLG